MNNDRRAFLNFGLAGAAVAGGLSQLLKVSPHEFNEGLTKKLLGARREAPTFPRVRAREPGANGNVGLDQELTDWALNFEAPGLPARSISLEEVKSLPRVDMTTELMCIEGWSEVVHWSGTPLRNIASPQAPEYVSLATPYKSYFVGLDLESALHRRLFWPGR